MARNTIVPSFLFFLVLFNMLKHSSTRTIQQSSASLKRSTDPTLDWGHWAARTQDFMDNFGHLLLPTQEPLDIDDTDSVRNYSVKLIKGTDGFTDDLRDFLLNHRNVTNVWDVYLLRNLLDLYAGIFIYTYSRLNELYTDIDREVQSFRGFGREVHKYFFLVNGYRSHLKKYAARTKKVLTSMLTAAPPLLALPCSYQPGIYLRLDRLMDTLAVPDPAAKMDSTEYFNIRAAKRNDSCIALPETFQRTWLKSSFAQGKYSDIPHEKTSVQKNAPPGGSFHGAQGRGRDARDADRVITLELSGDCLPFRFVSVGEDGRAPYLVQALVEGAPHALHFSEAPLGGVVLRPLQHDGDRGSASGGPEAGLLATTLLPLRLAAGEVLLVHRGEAGDRQFLAMEHVTDGLMLPWPGSEAVPEDGSNAAMEDQTGSANWKLVKKVDEEGGFHGAYDAVQGRGTTHARRNKRRQGGEDVSFHSNFGSREEELQLNDLNEFMKAVHDDPGAGQPGSEQRKVDAKRYIPEFHLGSTQSLVYVMDYQGEGTHWLLEKLV